MINPIDGSLQVFAAPQRKISGSNSSGSLKEGTELWGELFKEMSKVPVAGDRPGYIVFPSPSQNQNKDTAAELQAVDLKPSKNWLFSNNNVKTAQLALKPGQHFEFDLYFYREINFNRDHLDIFFEKENKSEKFVVEITNSLKHQQNGTVDKSKQCRGRMMRHEKEKVTIDVELPSQLSAGWWNMHVVTNVQNVDDQTGNTESQGVVNGLYVM